MTPVPRGKSSKGILALACVWAIACAKSCFATSEPLDYVDPFIGTEGKGNTLPGPTAPFALIQPGPDSGSVDIAGRKNPRYCNGYKRDDGRIVGFTQTHLSGTGCPDLCDFLLLPFTGDAPVWGWKDRDTETSRPGYYSVFFTNTHVRTEITATRRCGVYRMTWAANARPRLLVDLQHGNVATYSGLANSNHVLASSSRIDRARNRLYVDNHVQAWLQNRHVSGVFAFSRPIASVAERATGRSGTFSNSPPPPSRWRSRWRYRASIRRARSATSMPSWGQAPRSNVCGRRRRTPGARSLAACRRRRRPIR